MTRYLDDYLAYIQATLPNIARWMRAALNAMDAAIVNVEDALSFRQTLDSFQAGETLAERDVVYLDGSNQWRKIDTDDTTPKMGPLRGFVVEPGGITSGNTGAVQVLGTVGGFSGLTPWAMVYAATTAGGYTQTKPTVTAGGGQVALVPLGMAISETSVLIQCCTMRYLKRESLDDEETLVIVHHSDAEAYTREMIALENVTEAASSIEAYAESNQDDDVPLKTQTIATYTADQCSGGTASASNYTVTGEPPKAFDDNNSTSWVWLGGTSGWLQYQFTSAKTIRRYTMRAGATAISMPKSWTFQYWNGSTWVTADTVSNSSGWASGEQRIFDVSSSNSAIYWRINVTSVDGGSLLTIPEMEMMEAASFNDLNEMDGQSFQIDTANYISQAKLYLKKTGSPTGNLTITIEADAGGDPSGTALATSDVVAASGLSTSYGWIDFDFSTPPLLDAGTTYWLVLYTTDDYSEFDYVQWGADSSAPSYGNGEMKVVQGGDWIATTYDACFDLYTTEKYATEPCVMGRWSAASGDLAARIGNIDSDNPATNTAFKNVSGDTLDVTCVVVME